MEAKLVVNWSARNVEKLKTELKTTTTCHLQSKTLNPFTILWPNKSKEKLLTTTNARDATRKSMSANEF